MILPEYYHFSARTRVVSGLNALQELPKLLRRAGGTNPMIVTDKGIVQAGLLDFVRKPLLASGFSTLTVYDEVPSDSDVDTVHAAAKMYRKQSCTCIIAVGGGSVLDTAKGINIVVSDPDAEAENFDIRAYSGAGAVNQELGQLIAVPTTSGTGSESTLVAVIKDHKAKRKLLFTSDALLPDAAVLDPVMTLTLPPFLTAATGMDALTHAIEAFTGLAKNPLSDGLALQSIRLITDNLISAVKYPDNKEHRLALAIGANLAGQAFSNSMVGLIHTIGHTAGSICGIHHGLCMSILLPYGLEYNLHKISDLLTEIAPVICQNTENSDKPASLECISAIRTMNKQLNLLTGGRHAERFHDVFRPDGKPAMKPEHISLIAQSALGDGSHFYNPEQFDYDDIKRILEASYWGYPLDRELIRKGHQK